MKRSTSFSRSSLLVLLLGLLLFTACEPDEIFIIEPPVIPEETGTTTTTTNPNDNEAPAAFRQMLADINALRAEGCRCGNQNMPSVGPLTWNGKIALAAQRHSDDLAQMGQLNHTGSDGSSAGDRLHAADYFWRTYGENIASGYPSASSVLQGWIDSPGHCRNLMGADFTEMGAARRDRYWTQVFARPQ